MCLLIPILVGLISAILGYLLGRLLGGNSNSNNENIDVYKNRISILEADLAACKASKGGSKGGGNGISSGAGNSGAGSTMMASSFAAGTATTASTSSGTKTAGASFDAAAAKAAIGKAVKQDDLTVVEGIGPKIKELFHNHDVKTWAALADCTVEKCQEVLKSGGKRYEIHKPGTWPEQSRLAAEGKWQELKDWQDKLDGGK